MTAGVLPWAMLLRMAASKGISPSAFWALSLAELSMVLGRDKPQLLKRADFKALMQQFPDKEPLL
jgi:hypothetical protein